MREAVETKTGSVSVGLLPMARLFFKVGATGFGGPVPMLALIQGEVVHKRRWFSQEEFDEAMMVGQMLPGPVVVDTVAYMSYRRKGWLGAVVCATSFILPSFLLMLMLTLLYLRYGESPQLSGVFKGIGSAVVAVVLTAAWRMGKPALKDPRSTALMVAAAGGLVLLQAPIPLLVLLAGAAGILLYRNPAELQGSPKKKETR